MTYLIGTKYAVSILFFLDYIPVREQIFLLHWNEKKTKNEMKCIDKHLVLCLLWRLKKDLVSDIWHIHDIRVPNTVFILTYFLLVIFHKNNIKWKMVYFLFIQFSNDYKMKYHCFSGKDLGRQICSKIGRNESFSHMPL